MKWFTRATVAAALFAGFAHAQNSPVMDSVDERVQHLMDVEVGFEQMVPPGTSIEAKEVLRTGTSGKDLVVQYHVFVKGVPADTVFNVINWPPNAEKPSVVIEGVSLGKEGS